MSAISFFTHFLSLKVKVLLAQVTHLSSPAPLQAPQLKWHCMQIFLDLKNPKLQTQSYLEVSKNEFFSHFVQTPFILFQPVLHSHF